MAKPPITVGEKVERDGYCLVMVRLMDLAKALGRMPCGEWDYTFRSDPRWRVCLNGGVHAEWKPPDMISVPRFNAGVMVNGWPAGLVDAAGGTLIAGVEEQLLAAITRELNDLANPAEIKESRR
jgi:hypothetical protein